MSYETHYARYDELQKTYKIKHGRYGLVPEEAKSRMTMSEVVTAERVAMEQYDVVVERVGAVYAGAKWKVLRNAPHVTLQDLAIICDKGNLCFGYRSEVSFDGSTIIIVYTD